MPDTRRQREEREERTLSARKLVEEYKDGGERTSLRFPAGVPQFKIEKEGTYEIDIIPYVCGKGNPQCDEGEPSFERLYHQHFRVGVDGNSYICLSTFGEKCPVCEEYARENLNPRLTEEEKKAVKQLKKKERQLFNIIDCKDRKKGIQIWDTSTYWFWQNLQARLKRAGEDSPYNLFADPAKGYTLIIGAVEKDSGGFTFLNCVIDGFERREKPYTWKIMDEAPVLDDMLVETDYEDLYNILKGESRKPKEEESPRGRKSFSVGGRKDEEEERPARRGRDEEEDTPRRSRREEPEPEETEVTAKEMEIEVESVVEHEDLGVCTVTKVARDGKTITVEDDRKKVHKDVPVGEFKLWDGDEDDPKEKDDEPAPRRGRREEPEDDPAPRGRRAAKEEEPEDDTPRRSRRREEPEPEPEDDAPRGRRSRREEPEEEADDAPRSRRGRREEPEDEPAPRGRRAAKEEPEDEPLEDTDSKDEPDDEPAPRRGRGRR